MKILHLYHDIMNLYGEYANVLALKRMLEKNEIVCEVDTLSVGDTLQILEYDFIYVGSGTESNQKYVLEHFKSYKEDLKNYLEAEKMLFMTGNSFEIMGKELKDVKGKVYEGIGFFDFCTEEQERTRNTSDAVFSMEGQDKLLVGFINKCSTCKGIETPLFQVKMGLGNENCGKTEGIRYLNFFGTHLTGPILTKNPYFLKYVAEILGKKEMNTEYLTYEKAGYEVTLRELNKRIIQK